jgi:GNAT superfamily N-acetyltransferase
MTEDELARRRTLMGRGAQGWVTPGMYGAVDDRHWAVVSGADSPDLNMALVHADDPVLLDRPLAEVAARGCPALLMLAGPGKALAGRLPASFQSVGEMPIMSVDLASTPTQPDPRVRTGTAADADAVIDLLVGAYGFAPDLAAISVAPLHDPVPGPMSIWLLEEGGTPVSCVTGCRVDDSVSVWAMATPPQHARRGYARALLAAVLHHAREDGASLGLLGATPAGLPLYEATGWRTHETWALYTDAVSEQFSH